MKGFEFWSTPGPITDLGACGVDPSEIPDSPRALVRMVGGLVFHYGVHGNIADCGIDADRIHDIDLRYADEMVRRLRERSGRPLAEQRAAHERVVGCCRDFAVLLVALARHRGIPARVRHGFATYFVRGWHLDHVVAEIRDGARWRVLDPMLAAGLCGRDGTAVDVDPTDVPPDHFVAAPRAWLACRAGDTDVDRWRVDPDLDVPGTAGLAYVRQSLVHDLAALAKRELLQWDFWGAAHPHAEPDADGLRRLDLVAELTAPGGIGPERLRALHGQDGFAVPADVSSFSPAVRQLTTVRLRPGTGTGRHGDLVAGL